MFGHRYFGRYFGARYFGPAAGEAEEDIFETPAIRIVTVLSEDRSVSVRAENRTAKVLAETRSVIARPA